MHIIFGIIEVRSVKNEELMKVLLLRRKEEPIQEVIGRLLVMPTWSRCSSGQESAMMKPKAQAEAPGPGGSTYRAEGTGDEKNW